MPTVNGVITAMHKGVIKAESNSFRLTLQEVSIPSCIREHIIINRPTEL